MVHLYFIWFMMKQSLHYCLSCYSSSIHYERERERERERKREGRRGGEMGLGGMVKSVPTWHKQKRGMSWRDRGIGAGSHVRWPRISPDLPSSSALFFSSLYLFIYLFLSLFFLVFVHRWVRKKREGWTLKEWGVVWALSRQLCQFHLSFCHVLCYRLGVFDIL